MCRVVVFVCVVFCCEFGCGFVFVLLRLRCVCSVSVIGLCGCCVLFSLLCCVVVCCCVNGLVCVVVYVWCV